MFMSKGGMSREYVFVFMSKGGISKGVCRGFSVCSRVSVHGYVQECLSMGMFKSVCPWVCPCSISLGVCTKGYVSREYVFGFSVCPRCMSVGMSYGYVFGCMSKWGISKDVCPWYVKWLCLWVYVQRGYVQGIMSRGSGNVQDVYYWVFPEGCLWVNDQRDYVLR